MSQIEGLLEEFCPGGVEFLALGEVVRIRNGGDHKKLQDGDVPVYGSGGIMRYVDSAAAVGPSVLIPRKGSLGSIFYVEGPFWVVDTIFRTEIDETRLNPRFLYHQLLTMRLGEMNQAAGVPSQTQSVLNRLRIPVPPLEVQQEIVRILDKFTELEAELEAELDARHKHYEHYLNSLTHPFSEDRILKPGWTEAKMGDLCRIEKGRTAIQKAVPGPYPLVTTARDRGTAADFQFDGDAACIPLISSRGHGFASIARIYHQSGRFALGNILAAALPYDPNTLSAEFLRAYLQSRKDFILVPLMRGGANVSLTIDSLKRLKVHFPSIDEQRRIVQILRKFESLIGDSPFGIPAEIAARRKQYEYYRDRLLTFKELAA